MHAYSTSRRCLKAETEACVMVRRRSYVPPSEVQISVPDPVVSTHFLLVDDKRIQPSWRPGGGGELVVGAVLPHVLDV